MPRNAIQSIEQPFALLVCFALAFVFWLLIALSQNQDTKRHLKLSYINQPTDQVLVNKLPSLITAEYAAPGWELLSDYFRRREIQIDLAQYRSNSLLLTNYNHDLFEAQLPSSYKVVRIKPDTIYMRYERAAQKKVPVALKTELDFEGAFGISQQPLAKPDSISVHGPASLLRDISQWPSELISLKGLTKSTTGSVDLKAVDAKLNLSLSEEQVDYAINVSEFTEGAIEVPINLPKGDSSLRLMQRSVQIRFQIPLEDYVEVTESSFTVEAAFPTGESKLLPLRLTSYPATARNLSFTPKNVEYFFIK